MFFGRVSSSVISSFGSQNCFHNYKMRSAMNDKPILPKSQEDRKCKGKGRKKAPSHMLTSICLHFSYASHDYIEDICPCDSMLFATCMHTPQDSFSHFICSVSWKTDFILHLTSSLAFWLPGLDSSKGHHEQEIRGQEGGEVKELFLCPRLQLSSDSCDSLQLLLLASIGRPLF